MLRFAPLLILLCWLPGCGSAPATETTASSQSVAPNGGRVVQTSPRVVAKIAAVQYQIEGGRSVARLIGKIVEHVEAAKKADARLVVFPELTLLDAWPLATAEADEPAAARKLAMDVTPLMLTTVGQLSRSTDIAILIGAPRMVGEELRNSAVLAFPDGRQVVQDKLFPTRWERRNGFTAGNELVVFEAPWGRSAITICYDVEIPAVSQALVTAKVEVLLVPSMAESHAGMQRVRWTAQARAVEHHAYVVLACTFGSPSATWQTYGRSAFISPRDDRFPGEIRQALPQQPGILVDEVDLTSLRESRATAEFYPARDQLNRTTPITVQPVREPQPAPQGANDGL